MDEKSTYYDECEMNLYDEPDAYIAENGDELGVEYEFQIIPAKPSFKFENAEEFFNSENLKPPYWRGDNGHDFTVEIVPTEGYEEWKTEHNRKCFNGINADPGSPDGAT